MTVGMNKNETKKNVKVGKLQNDKNSKIPEKNDHTGRRQVQELPFYMNFFLNLGVFEK